MAQGSENGQNKELENFLKFQIERKITNLFKSFLEILEDMEFEQVNISKEHMERYRKRILDKGNQTFREIEQDFSKLEIRFKK